MLVMKRYLVLVMCFCGLPLVCSTGALAQDKDKEDPLGKALQLLKGLDLLKKDGKKADDANPQEAIRRMIETCRDLYQRVPVGPEQKEQLQKTLEDLEKQFKDLQAAEGKPAAKPGAKPGALPKDRPLEEKNRLLQEELKKLREKLKGLEKK
jgi:uncharacterized coiled-coil DUF342 family protein